MGNCVIPVLLVDSKDKDIIFIGSKIKVVIKESERITKDGVFKGTVNLISNDCFSLDIESDIIDIYYEEVESIETLGT